MVDTDNDLGLYLCIIYAGPKEKKLDSLEKCLRELQGVQTNVCMYK
jgi:hypothetical protein